MIDGTKLATTYLRPLLGALQSLQDAHQRMVDSYWPSQLPFGKILYGALALFVIVAAGINAQIRLGQLQVWEDLSDHSADYSVQNFSTADAPYFMGLAKTFEDSLPKHAYLGKRSFPNNATSPFSSDPHQQRPKSDARDFPLLSVMISLLSPTSQIDDLIEAGHRLIPLTAALTALMIILAFGAAGYWFEGTVAGLGGGLSAAYLMRTSIGRIDTDQLNLGLLYLMFAFVLLTGRSRHAAVSLAFAVLAGITAHALMWWYERVELIWIALFAFAWILLTSQQSIRIKLLCLALFVFISGLRPTNPFNSPYFQETIVNASFIYAQTFETITERAEVSQAQILVNIAGSVEMGIFCLVGLTLCAVRHPVIAIAYSPLAGFAILSFFIGQRAIFYSAPIFWFGGAYLITTGARFIASHLYPGSDDAVVIRNGHRATIAATAFSMIVVWANSPTEYVPRPSFPKPVLEGFASLKESTSHENSAVATWWDYGYASLFVNNLPVFHDGGTQTGPATHFIARSLLESDQPDSISILKLLSTGGNAAITRHSTVESLLESLAGSYAVPSPDIYLVVTNQMSGWMGSISKLGNWDIETGKPVSLRNNPDGPKVDYRRLNCRLKDYPRSLNCQGVEIDLQRGFIGGRPLLIGWTHTKDGEILRRRDFNHDADHAVQIVQEGTRLTVYFLHRQLYESTFNKLYHQGLVEHPAISLHYDDYPHIRIYRIDGNPDG